MLSKSKDVEMREDGKFKEIGVDLGNKNIKISYIDEENSGKIIDKIFLAEDYFNISEYFKIVKRAIKSFIGPLNMRHISLNIIIPCDNKYLFADIFEMRKVPEEILEDSILYNMEASFPISRKDYFHRYKILSRDMEKNSIRVLSMMLDQEFREEILRLQSRRWKLSKCIPQYNAGKLIDEDEVALIDYGYSITRIYLYKASKLVDLKTIPIGSNEFIEAIKESLNMDDEEADRILREGKVFSEEFSGHSEEICGKLEKLTEKISDNLKRAIRVMELNNNTIINKFYYTGGIAQLLDFINFLKKDIESEMEAFTLKSIDNVRDYLDLESVNLEVLEDPFIYSRLASYEFGEEFNFISDVGYFIDRTALLVATLVFVIIINLGLFYINNSYDENIKNSMAELSKVEKENYEIESELSDLKSEIDRNKKIIDRVENLKEKKKWVSDILYVLPKETPNNVVITKIDIIGRHVILEGYSEDYSNVAYLAMALEDYGKVEITEVGEYREDKKSVGNKQMEKEFKIDIQYENRLING